MTRFAQKVDNRQATSKKRQATNNKPQVASCKPAVDSAIGSLLLLLYG
jgi:hypothetical protein